VSDITTTDALAYLLPKVEFTLIDDSYDSIVWGNEPANKPTLDQITNAKKVLKQDLIDLAAERATAKAALLERLGITADEAALLLS
jgi:hypothetical protein